MELAKVYSLKTHKAKQLVEDGKHQISIGDLDVAAETFQKSIELDASADAYTYLGWVLSLKNQTDEAIELCKKAIAIDPDFGNPYNDIGSYLIQKNLLTEAIPWLESAKKAKRYEPKHFPYLNLGRVYSAQGRIDEAITEFKIALKYAPEHQEIKKVLLQLENIKNPSN
ncbi:MAG: tetratricopeptide repeat protein [Oligoflexia bacterium]|nr:tetratricopeptide repeat protein [Oligoflexia bacterium]